MFLYILIYSHYVYKMTFNIEICHVKEKDSMTFEAKISYYREYLIRRIRYILVPQNMS
jgi:hypothetical protein